MTRIASISTALLVLGALMAAPAQAAAGDTSFSPDGAERHCAFVAEAGGYVCTDVRLHGSLSDLQDGNTKKLGIKLPKVPSFQVPKFP